VRLTGPPEFVFEGKNQYLASLRRGQQPACRGAKRDIIDNVMNIIIRFPDAESKRRALSKLASRFPRQELGFRRSDGGRRLHCLIWRPRAFVYCGGTRFNERMASLRNLLPLRLTTGNRAGGGNRDALSSWNKSLRQSRGKRPNHPWRLAASRAVLIRDDLMRVFVDVPEGRRTASSSCSSNNV